MVSLQKIDCSCNKLTTLPAEIGQLSQLQTFYCDNNKLTVLPTEIGQLSQLREFSCSYNQLTVLPTEIGQLSQLQSFYCNNNQLTVLSTEIGQLRYLTYFEYSGNQIEYIPPNLIRIIDRITNHQRIYSDAQNVHNHDIQKCITKSIQNILNIKPLDFDLSQYIINDTIFTEQTKQLLFEHIGDQTIHSFLNITFEELLVSVLSRIEANIHYDEIKSIMNISFYSWQNRN